MDFNEDTFLLHQIPFERNSSVIGILDMDAFEVAIYRKIYPGNDRVPCIVCNSSNRILSVSYEAKIHHGITRKDSRQSAESKCSNLKVFVKREQWGKPETKPLRHASMKVRDAIKLYRSENGTRAVIQYESNDEFFFDLTEEVTYRMNNSREYRILNSNIGEQTYLEGNTKQKGPAIVYRHDKIYPNDVNKYWEEDRFVYGAVILEDIRRFVFEKTAFQASCGIASNPLLAKLACPLHKPGGITILTETGLPRKSKSIKIEDIRGLGGILGEKVKNMLNRDKVRCDMSGLSLYSIEDLKGKGFDPESTALKVYNLAHGICHDKVVEKLMKDGITTGKTFQNRNPLNIQDLNHVEEEISNLSKEMLIDRLPEERKYHHRTTDSIKFEIKYMQPRMYRKPQNVSFRVNLNLNNVGQFTLNALEKFKKNFSGKQGKIVEMSLSAQNFQPV